MTDKCERMGMLISRMLDGEMFPAEKEILSQHMAECPHCRDFYEKQLKYNELLEGSQEGLDLPECPVISREPVKVFHMSRYLKSAAAILLIGLSFYGGFLTGDWKALDNIPAYARVGVPAVWTRESSPSMEMEARQLSPLQNLISEYQFLIGEELGAEEVDWQKVRIMVETLGSLRTDLEILALHKGYMDEADRGKGSPRETWQQMIGIKNFEESL